MLNRLMVSSRIKAFCENFKPILLHLDDSVKQTNKLSWDQKGRNLQSVIQYCQIYLKLEIKRGCVGIIAKKVKTVGINHLEGLKTSLQILKYQRMYATQLLVNNNQALCYLSFVDRLEQSEMQLIKKSLGMVQKVDIQDTWAGTFTL